MCSHERHCSSGLTLIEMLLALTLSLILIAGLCNFCVSIKKYFRQQSGLVYVGQNLRLISEILMREVNYVGFSGAKYYFFEKTSRRNPDGTAVYALYRKDTHHVKTEMIENISSFDVHYDVIENNHLAEKNKDQVKTSKKVVGVLFHFTLRDLSGFIHKEGYVYAAIRKKRNRVGNGVGDSPGRNAPESLFVGG